MSSSIFNVIELSELVKSDKVKQHAEMEFFQQGQKSNEAGSSGFWSFSLERPQIEDVLTPTAIFSALGFILSAALGGPAGLMVALMILSVTAVLALVVTDFDDESLCGSSLGMRTF